MEELKEKGILANAVIGGTIVEQTDLEARTCPALAAAHPGVPVLVAKAIAVADRHLDEQGLYRLSGNSAQIQRLVGKGNSSVASLDLDHEQDVHCVTGLLKLYFRELAEPIFTDALYADFIAVARAYWPL